MAASVYQSHTIVVLIVYRGQGLVALNFQPGRRHMFLIMAKTSFLNLQNYNSLWKQAGKQIYYVPCPNHNDAIDIGLFLFSIVFIVRGI